MIKVLIVDDDPFIRIYMRNLLGNDPSVAVVGEADSGEKAVALVQSLQPDVVTMDVEMPGMDGLRATHEIMAHTPRPVIMVSSFTREDTEATIQALQNGAVDFISKSTQYLGLDIAHLETELKRKIQSLAHCSMSELDQHRAQNLARLQQIKHTSWRS
ncbi:MAG: response regulator [Magnetococcales bacterium]|nr:response regulator [Magnetococcales bacterium]MBF0114226.1 response regulator [Magnetococcales bacterium]